MSTVANAAYAEQAEELEAIQAIFGEDCDVQSAEPGQMTFALHIFADIGICGEANVKVRAMVAVENDTGNEESNENEVATGTTVSADLVEESTSAVDRAEQLLQRRTRQTSALAIDRSLSGNHMTCPEAVVKHLPPLTLQLSLPSEYPIAGGPPSFHLACVWLTSGQLAHLCSLMDIKAEEMSGSPVIFSWGELLRDATAALITDNGTSVTLAVSTESPDIRAVAECTDPMAAMMEVLQYDHQRELAAWRQEIQQCLICFTGKPGSQFVHLGGCLHAFCRECVTEMARLHVMEGSILELRCPQPDCRAEISPNALEYVLDDEAYERWHSLKLQQIMTSELEGLVFCPRCEEMGRDTPVLSERPVSEDEAPLAICKRCGYMFCGRCLGVAHSSVTECISAEDRAVQAAMRRETCKNSGPIDKRQRQRSLRGVLFELPMGKSFPKVDAAGCVTEELGPMKVGDEILAVHSGAKHSKQLLWSRAEHDLSSLEKACMSSPPLAIRYRTPQTTSQQERDRKRRAMEELMTLREIKKDSQTCPKCHVRIMRSQGCNHMMCTNCGTHFCYRCGQTLSPSNPYGHFSESGCPTFDRQEVQRIVAEQHRGVDNDLEDLRRQFGRQEEALAHFNDRRQLQMRPVVGGDGRRRLGDTLCPTCRHWNGRQGRLNHVRCQACRTSYCAHCGRRIVGVITDHYRGEGACPQHGEV